MGLAVPGRLGTFIMHQTISAAAPTAFLPAPPRCAIRFLIADADKNFRDSAALIMSAMDGGSVVCRASNAIEAGEWLATNPFAWDVALVDAEIASDPASGLRYCGRHVLTGQVVVVLRDGARLLPHSVSEAAVLACYDKRRDMARIVALCIQLRDRRTKPGAPVCFGPGS
jgi:DNA-binding NarL/FixJ family response regulator